MARPIATRCCSPPDKVDGLRFNVCVTRSSSATSPTRFFTSELLTPDRRSGWAKLASTLRCGYSAKVWKIIDIPRPCTGALVTFCPAKCTLPLSNCSKPAIERKVVVLPEDDGPSRQKNSPSCTSKLMSSSATTDPKVRRRFWTFSSDIHPSSLAFR